MKPRSPRSVLLPLAAGLVQFLSGCMASTVNDPDKSAGGSDEIDTRVAVDRSGKPVIAARIALVRADDSTGKPVAVSATGKDGSFPTFVVPDGLYSVVLRDAGDSLGKFVDSVAVKSQKLPAGRDTLLALGSVRGVVRVAAGHSPATVTVGLLGTDILANVKADGTFRIELVPGGLYTLGAFPILDGYGPLYKRIQLKDGQDLTLPDTLVMPFTGLPSPGALRVLQDTGTGNVRVSWNRVDHPDLLGYVLERVEGGTVTASRYLTDTTWIDSLGASWEAMPLLGPWPSREAAYRVRARSLGGSPDSKSAAQALTAKPPEWTKQVVVPEPILAQDSISGNVKLVWTVVRHPLLKGYVVERIAGGKVVTSSIVRDTLYLDTLGHHWDGLPLSGPWPDLQVDYRIGAIAKDTARGTVASLQGHAPTWVKSVDSTRIVVTQDTSTGNVHIGWSSVKHPHLVGYAVDRIENGFVQSGRTVIDTVFIDSLGAYWTGLPLLGPWPKRQVSYRVRLVADRFGTDGLSGTVAFDAQPPAWTKHIDSVKVVMTTDSVTGVTTLKWNAPKHPDLLGWSISRAIDGNQDCSEVGANGEWTDSKCSDVRFENVDSTRSSKNQIRLVREKTGSIRYSLQTQRRVGTPESIAEPSRKLESNYRIIWRDSVLSDPDNEARFEAFGGWILKRHVSNAKTIDAAISRDGVSWEAIPHALDVVTGIDDSVWTGELSSDGLHLTLRCRQSFQDWKVRTVTLPSKAQGIKQLTVLDGKLVVGIRPASDPYGGDSIWVVSNDSTLLPSKIGGVGPDMSSMFNYQGIPVTKRLRVDVIGGPSSTIVSVVNSGNVVVSKDLLWKSGSRSGLIGVVGTDGGTIVSYNNPANPNQLGVVYLSFGGETVLLNESALFSSSSQSYLGMSQVFRDEIWTMTDGHIWKGKLSLPNLEKP